MSGCSYDQKNADVFQRLRHIQNQNGTTSYCFSADNSEKHPLQISLPLKGKLICKGFRAFRMPIEYNLCTKCNISQYHGKALSLHRACHNA